MSRSLLANAVSITRYFKFSVRFARHEHDFGALEVDGERVFFKLEYYDLTRAMHSEDAADPAKTERVMTIMLSDEY